MAVDASPPVAAHELPSLPRRKQPHVLYHQDENIDITRLEKVYDQIFEQVLQQFIDNNKVLHL